MASSTPEDSRKPKPPKLTVSQYKRGHDPETLRRVAALLRFESSELESSYLGCMSQTDGARTLGASAELLRWARRFERDARAAGKVK